MADYPEALRLADHLERFRSFPDDLEAAAELRRLAAVEAERDALRAALDKYRGQLDRFGVHSAADAIAKAKGGGNG